MTSPSYQSDSQRDFTILPKHFSAGVGSPRVMTLSKELKPLNHTNIKLVHPNSQPYIKNLNMIRGRKITIKKGGGRGEKKKRLPFILQPYNTQSAHPPHFYDWMPFRPRFPPDSTLSRGEHSSTTLNTVTSMINGFF